MEKIDFVIAWVDGSDPAWQAEKARYRPTGDSSAIGLYLTLLLVSTTMICIAAVLFVAGKRRGYRR